MMKDKEFKEAKIGKFNLDESNISKNKIHKILDQHLKYIVINYNYKDHNFFLNMLIILTICNSTTNLTNKLTILNINIFIFKIEVSSDQLSPDIGFFWTQLNNVGSMLLNEIYRTK